MRAPEFLKAGLGHMEDRAATYDKPQGERSMGMTVALVNVLLAEKLREPLSEEDGWNFMELLKLVRSKQGQFKADNYEDRAAYAGLAGEAGYLDRSISGTPPAPAGQDCTDISIGRPGKALDVRLGMALDGDEEVATVAIEQDGKRVSLKFQSSTEAARIADALLGFAPYAVAVSREGGHDD